MTCERMRERIIETGRGRELASDERAGVFAHAAGCETCRKRLEAEHALSVALAEVAMRTEAAPARIEHLLLKQFPAPMRKPRGRSLWVSAGLAAAAALILTAVLTRPGNSPKQAIPRGEAAAEYRNETVVAKPLAPMVQPRRTPARTRVAAVPRQSLSSPFIALPYAEDLDPEERSEVVLVQFRREALGAVGLPVSPAVADEQVRAEVLVAADGTARAIRLVD